MRKFLSLTLAVIMVALAIPFTVSAAVTAPTTLSDGTEIELTSITNGYMEGKGDNVAVSKFATAFNSTTKTVFDNGNHIDISQYKGMIFKVDSTKGKLQWYFVFKYGDGTEETFKGSSATYYWWDGAKWIQKTAGSTSYEAGGAEGYAYVDFAVFNTKSDEISNLKIYTPKSTTRAGKISEWSLASVAKDTPELAPDGSKMVLTSITDGTMTNPGTNEANISKFASQFDNTTKTIFDDVKVIDTTYCKGMLLRVNSTKSLVQWRFIITCEGVETAYEVKKKAFSWWDGTEWKDGEPKDNNNGLTSSGYVYVAFDELDLPSNKITNLKLYSAKSASRAGVFSKWSLVQTELQAEEHPLVEERTYDKTSHVIKGIQYFDNAGDTYSIRLVGGIDGYEKYDRVGYEVSFFNGVDKIGTLDAMSASAYISINQNVDGRINAITAEQLGVKYITAIAITDIPETCSTYVVASYVIVDGNKVYSNKVTINRHDDWNK